MKTENNWKRGAIQLLMIGAGIVILASPFLLVVIVFFSLMAASV